MADLPTNWVDNIGMVEDAAFLNLVGTNVNANSRAQSSDADRDRGEQLVWVHGGVAGPQLARRLIIALLDRASSVHHAQEVAET